MNYPDNWEVPEYKVLFDNNPSKDFAVIIPVLNEGNRIKSLLEKMSLNSIHEIADIIIVDGGSSDGSLDPRVLKSLKVAVLLEKTGEGRLSAQLRCAYAYAYVRQYRGVVTIDGNDKDDPKDIPKFISLICEGYDFVQASRFLPGGYAENTPLIRNLAIKLIHAPMLSIASGFRWTDTTQGFRGYSIRLLTSRRLNIFRNVFRNYELLAYLSYAAPKYGFKCIESATSRVYPKGEIPTKISAIRGNLDLLKTLWSICQGHFDVR